MCGRHYETKGRPYETHGHHYRRLVAIHIRRMVIHGGPIYLPTKYIFWALYIKERKLWLYHVLKGLCAKFR